MNYFSHKFFWLCSFLWVSVVILPAQSSQDPYDLIQKMFQETGKVKNLVYVLKKGERFNGKIFYQESFTKVAYFPLRIYTRTLGLEGGEEVLYVAGKNKNRALVHPVGFPWTNINLDPRGKLMRANQHHILLDAGYVKVIPIVQYQFSSFPDKIRSFLKKGKDQMVGSTACYTITYEHSGFKWESYTVPKGETLISLAEKKRLSAYMIIEKNPALTDFSDPIEGLTLQVPTLYARKMELLIEKDRKLLRGFKVYDDLGLFEHFEFKELDINQPLSDRDFTEDFPGYGF